MDQEILNKVKSAILSIDKDAQIILFGSRARGDFKPESDWDFLILTSFPVDEQKKEHIRNKIFDTELETEQSISTLIFSKDYWNDLEITHLYQLIKNEGIPV